jgi:EmrB/QacA subfamily drug resistance transporter
MTTATLAPARAPAPPAIRSGVVLAVLLVGQFMAILDVSVVNVAVPTIRTDLGTSGAGLQLIVAGYTISYAVLLVTGARLGDRFGHGRAFRTGLALFTAASLACGVAPTSGALIACRVIQGVGAAVMMPQVMSLIQRTFAGAARARALSLYAAVIACGAVVGQVLGGVLVSADMFGLEWRPVFLVNVPIGVALLVMARRGLPSSPGDPARQMDPAGVVTLSAAVLALVLPLVLGHEENWPLWCWGSLALSVALFGVFALVERAVGRPGGTPLVPGRVLRLPGLTAAMCVLILAMICWGGFLLAMALHLQQGLGYSPAKAGLTFAPTAIGFAVTGLTWRMLPARWHAQIIPVGLAASVIAYLLLAVTLRDGRPIGTVAELELLALGLALGLAFSPILTVALAGVPMADAADASGVLVTVFQLGQVVGVATLGTLYLSLVDGPGPAESASAMAWTLVGLAAASAVSSVVSRRLVSVRSL